MSSEPESPESPDIGDETGRFRTLEKKIEALHKQVASARECAEARAEEAERRVDELEAEVETLRDRTSLIDHVQRASARKPDERAAVLIQTLYAEATRRGERENGEARAAMEATEAVKALGGDADRTNMYGENGIFNRAVELAPDDAPLRYIRESRASKRNSRLALNLEDGDLPNTIQGHSITGEHDE